MTCLGRARRSPAHSKQAEAARREEFGEGRWVRGPSRTTLTESPLPPLPLPLLPSSPSDTSSMNLPIDRAWFSSMNLGRRQPRRQPRREAGGGNRSRMGWSQGSFATMRRLQTTKLVSFWMIFAMSASVRPTTGSYRSSCASQKSVSSCQLTGLSRLIL